MSSVGSGVGSDVGFSGLAVGATEGMLSTGVAAGGFGTVVGALVGIVLAEESSGVGATVVCCGPSIVLGEGAMVPLSQAVQKGPGDTERSAGSDLSSQLEP